MKGISSAFLVILFITFFAIPQFTSASEMEDLENPTKQEARSGFAVKQTVHVYDQTSKDSQVLKVILWSFLKYRTHSKDWYEATVILSGKPETGYIHKGDVNEAPPAITGYSMKSPTKVYAKDSQKSKAIKSYLKGSKLKYKYYNKNWYIATVYLKGKKHTGYISKDDVGAKKPKVTAADKFKTIDKNDQLILVTSKGYKTNKAAIRTFEKKNGEWKQVLSVQGHIGKNGFAKSKRGRWQKSNR